LAGRLDAPLPLINAAARARRLLPAVCGGCSLVSWRMGNNPSISGRLVVAPRIDQRFVAHCIFLIEFITSNVTLRAARSNIRIV
jgi:hypothetical protein